MKFVGDERGQSIQVGAVLLFAVLIIAFSTYQAFVVPDQNREIEFNHNQEVQQQLQDLRNAIVSVPGTGSSQSVSVQLGTRYPSRAVAVNPGPVSGALRTNGTTNISNNLTISAAVASGPSSDEVGDFWNGSTQSYNTGSLVYSPNYNLYTNAPETYYEHSVTYNRFPSGTRIISGQTLVDGRELTIVSLNGSVSRSSARSTSVDVRPVSRPEAAISVTNASGGTLTVSFLSRLDATTWREDILAEEYDPSPTVGGADDDRYVSAVSQTPGPGPFYVITLQFEGDVDYQLRMGKVGIGTQVTEEDTAYLADVSGDGIRVEQGEKARITVAARDRYNNPVSANRSINVTTDNGALESATVYTGTDGTATVSYDASGASTGSAHVNFSLGSGGSPFDGSTTENVTIDLTVTGGGGSSAPYTTSWLDPSGEEAVVSCTSGPGSCTVDADGALVESFDAAVTTTPTVDGASVTYATGNRSVVRGHPTSGVTNATGENTTTAFVYANGTTDLYATSGASGDRVEIVAMGLRSNVSATAEDPDATGTVSGVNFTVRNDANRSLRITEITLASSGTNINALDDPDSGQGQWDSEFFVETSAAGSPYTADFNPGRSLPETFDLSTAAAGTSDREPSIPANSEATFSLYQFRDAVGGNAINVSGKRIDLTLTFANGDSTSFYVVPGGSGTGTPTAPTISSYSVTNPSGRDVQVSFDSDESLSTIDVGISGAETGSLDRGDFSETVSGGTYTYTGTYTGSTDGDYTATLNTAADADGNDGASGESGTVTVSTTKPTITASSFSDGDNTVTDAEANANVQRTVSFTFDRDMDTSVVPTVTYENISGGGSTYTVVSEGWQDARTYEQTLSFADNDVDTPVTVVVSDAEGTNGVQMNTERPLSFIVDTQSPGDANSVRIDTPRINSSNVGNVNATLVNPDTLYGDETAVLTLLNQSTSDSVTVTKRITTGEGSDTSFTGIDVSGLPDGSVYAEGYVRDDVGNTGGTVGPSDETTKDTVAPSIGDFRATNPSGDTVRVTFNASEPLDAITLPVTYEDGTTVRTFDEGTLSQNQVGENYEYTTSFTAGQDGDYTGEVTFANDSAGNLASTGQSDKTTIGPSGDYVVNTGSTADAFGTGSLNLSLDNTAYRPVTVRNITVTTGSNKIKSIYETSGGTGVENREVYISAASDTGYLENGDNPSADIKGQTVSLTDTATLDSRSGSTVSIAYFRDNQGPRTTSGLKITVTIGFADGSEVTYALRP